MGKKKECAKKKKKKEDIAQKENNLKEHILVSNIMKNISIKQDSITLKLYIRIQERDPGNQRYDSRYQN